MKSQKVAKKLDFLCRLWYWNGFQPGIPWRVMRPQALLMSERDKPCTRGTRKSALAFHWPGWAIVISTLHKFSPNNFRPSVALACPPVQRVSLLAGAGCGWVVRTGFPPSPTPCWVAVVLSTRCRKSWRFFCQNLHSVFFVYPFLPIFFPQRICFLDSVWDSASCFSIFSLTTWGMTRKRHQAKIIL